MHRSHAPARPSRARVPPISSGGLVYSCAGCGRLPGRLALTLLSTRRRYLHSHPPRLGRLFAVCVHARRGSIPSHPPLNGVWPQGDFSQFGFGETDDESSTKVSLHRTTITAIGMLRANSKQRGTTSCLQLKTTCFGPPYFIRIVSRLRQIPGSLRRIPSETDPAGKGFLLPRLPRRAA